MFSCIAWFVFFEVTGRPMLYLEYCEGPRAYTEAPDDRDVTQPRWER